LPFDLLARLSQRDDTPIVTLLKVNRTRRTSSLLFATALLAACGAGCTSGGAGKPDLPVSVSPGWKQLKMEASGAPAGLPQGGTPPVCWRADYKSEGDATVWTCGYGAAASALDASQRMPAAAREVKFQRGPYLVVVQWNNVSQTGITALVGAVERSIPDK